MPTIVVGFILMFDVSAGTSEIAAIGTYPDMATCSTKAAKMTVVAKEAIDNDKIKLIPVCIPAGVAGQKTL